ncbi:NAD kinase [Spirochaetia bacterium]|nr:NAD kinase [Spirochaetia bacterium]
MRALLFVNLHKKKAASMSEEIRLELEKRGVAVTVFPFEGKPACFPEGKWDIAFSLGGDGTVLYAARTLAGAGVPILAVNLGTLGFIACVDSDRWLAVFDQWTHGTVLLSRRCMFEITLERRRELIMKNCCLNDAVISAAGIAKLIKLDVHSETSSGEYTELGFYRCDGLIIATPTGSTAYSMAAGGPILDPEMEALLLTPICPFTLSNRPMVLPSRQALLVTVGEEQRSGVLLTVDGQDTFDLEPGDRIIVRQAPWQALLVSAERRSYYSALRTKLSWSGAVNGDNVSANSCGAAAGGGFASRGGVAPHGGVAPQGGSDA